MNELMIFNNPEFGEIRTIEEGGKVLFCGSDVAKALGYKNPTKATGTPPCSTRGSGCSPPGRPGRPTRAAGRR